MPLPCISISAEYVKMGCAGEEAGALQDTQQHERGLRVEREHIYSRVTGRRHI